ncbi:hypothetical protein BGW41_000522 [Actinomortierella wolfii]|nr:hypothetical protein BGW41_000522 [Actinomortierella wolfii]
MTSQPLVASVCVDYLSHPLSAEGLLLCYQQITRQVAHAPLTAKEAASTFQNQSNAELDLLQQHSYNLAIPNKRDCQGPAPVGCQAQLRRMQNALWRRSSQLSLAKDVALVQPETLNWQKECDVLWLYGPLYHPYFASAEQQASPTVPATTTVSSPDSVECEQEQPTQDYFNIALSSPSPLPSISTAAAAVHSDADTTVATISSPTSPTSLRPSSALSSKPSSQPQPQPQLPQQQQRHHRRMTTDETPTADSAPRPLRSASISTSDTALATKARDIPRKSSLKRLGTRQQQLDELRAFLHSQEYKLLTQMLLATTAASAICSSSCSQQPREDGTCSAPVTPIMTNPPMLAMPMVPAPTRYHFRSTDRQRRASFPKYVTHPSSSSSLSTTPSFAGGDMTTTNGGSPSGSLNGKQLRFSLEVQELVFLPSSPPFRVSRAKPIRANSDPAVQSVATSSFLAPPLGYRHQPHLRYNQQQLQQQSLGADAHNSIATATSIGSSGIAAGTGRTLVVRTGNGVDNTVVGNARGRIISGGVGSFRVSRAAHHGLALDLPEEEEGIDFGIDDVGARNEHHRSYRHLYSPVTSFLKGQHDKRKYSPQTYYQSMVDEIDHEEDEDEDVDEVDVDDDIFFPTMETIPEDDSHKDGTVVRRIEQQHQLQQEQQHKGVLWRVYTVVTGVRDIVAWCGSMVYYSSTL